MNLDLAGQHFLVTAATSGAALRVEGGCVRSIV